MVKTTVRVLFVAVLVSPAGSRAAPAQPSSSAYAIILGGGKTVSDAEEAAQRYRSATALTAPQGFPKITASSDVPGLNPGFVIAIAGFCSSEEHARLARDVLNLDAPGVYIKKVGVAASAGTCPTSRADLKTDWTGYSVKATQRVASSGKHLLWESLETSGRCRRVGLRLKWGTTLVATRAFEGDQCEPDGTRVWFASRPLEIGQRTFWLVTKATDWVHAGKEDYSLVGFACGEIRELYVAAGFGDPAEVVIEPSREEPEGWRELVVTLNGESSHVLWNASSCRYELK